MFPNLIRPAGFGIAAVSGGGSGYSTAIATLQDSTGMTQVVSAFADDASQYLPDVGFNFPIYGSTYRSNIAIGSNWYLLFGLTSIEYSSLSHNNPGRGLLFGAADRSWQNVYFKAESGFCRIRFEGHVTSSGTSYTAIFQIKLFADGTIELTIGIGCFYNPTALTLVQSLTKGDGITYTDFTVPTGSVVQSDFTSTAVLTSLVFSPVDAAGSSHTVRVGSYSAPVVAARNTTLLNALSYVPQNNADYTYYQNAGITYDMLKIADSDTTSGMMISNSPVGFIKAQLSAPAYLNRIDLWNGSLYGDFDDATSIKIFAGFVTSETGTPLYTATVSASQPMQSFDLSSIAAFNTAMPQITIVVRCTSTPYVSVREIQLRGHSA